MAKNKRPDKKALEKIVKDKLKLIESSPEKVYSAAEKEQKRLLENLLSEIGDLDTKDGVIQITERNINKVDGIVQRLKKDFYKSGYIDSVKGMIGDLDSVKKLTDDYFKEGFGKFKNDKSGLIFSSAKKNVFDALAGTSAMETTVFKPIANNILDAITNGTTFKELQTNIKTTITGNDQVAGQLQRYAKTWAGTSFSITERNYTKSISDVLKIQWYRYVGGEIQTTRCFCDERNGKYYHIEEIKSWGRMENLGDCNTGNGWSGMIKGTNEGNIMSNLGGWGCLHSLVPVSVLIVPMPDIKRAMDEGWYTPTKQEAEALGIAA